MRFVLCIRMYRSRWTWSLSSAVGLFRLMITWSGTSIPYKYCEFAIHPFWMLACHVQPAVWLYIVVILLPIAGCGNYTSVGNLRENYWDTGIASTSQHSIMHVVSTCTCTCMSHLCLQTLCALLRAIFQKKLADMSFDVIDVLMGFDSAECQMRVGPC